MNVFLVCTGVGIMNRGIETFARECFDGLHGTDGLDLKLFKGAGPESTDEHRLWTLPRTSHLAEGLGALLNRDGYVVEQLLFFPSLVHQIRRERPDLIFYSEMNLGFQLYRWREQIGVPYRLLFSNGAPVEGPFERTDFVQQVTPQYQERAIEENGGPPEKHIQVPYGINVPDGSPTTDPTEKQRIRQRLDLPPDREIVLSVGWIRSYHKRMDYVIREVAALSEPRPHLVMLGHMDEKTPPILELAEEELGTEGFTARSVPYEEVDGYYRAADVFALGSVREGFGRVYMESLLHGLPTIAHNGPVMEYVLGEEGVLADLREEGSLSDALHRTLQKTQDRASMKHRREYVRQRFGWSSLSSDYLDMFRYCINH